MSTITINCKTLGPNGTSHELTISPTATITQVKDEIRAQNWASTDEFRLLLNGRSLDNTQTLESLNIRHGSTLYIVHQRSTTSSSTTTATTTTTSESTTTTAPPQQQQPQQQLSSLFQAFNNQNSLQGLPGSNHQVQSSYIQTDNAPPPSRWYPGSIHTSLSNIWEPERSFNGVVHRLPYSSRLSQQIPTLQQSSEVEYLSRGYDDEHGFTSPSSSNNNSTSSTTTTTTTTTTTQPSIDLDQPPYPIPDNVSAYAYPLHLLSRQFEQAQVLIRDVTQRILNEASITTVEEIESLRFDTRRLGAMLRRFGTAAIDLGSALNHIDFGEPVPSHYVGTLAPNPPPGQQFPLNWQTPQIEQRGSSEDFPEERVTNVPSTISQPTQPILHINNIPRQLRIRNPSRLRGPQLLHQTASQLTINPLQMLFGGGGAAGPNGNMINIGNLGQPQQQQQRRNGRRARQNNNTNTNNPTIPSSSTSSSTTTPSQSTSTETVPLTTTATTTTTTTTLPAEGEIGIELPNPMPEIPSTVAISLPPDYLPILGHQPLGIPQPNYYQGLDMFHNPSQQSTTTSSSSTTPSADNTTSSITPPPTTTTMTDDVTTQPSTTTEQLQSATTQSSTTQSSTTNDNSSDTDNDDDDNEQQQQQQPNMFSNMNIPSSVQVTSIQLELDPETGQLRPSAPATSISVGDQTGNVPPPAFDIGDIFSMLGGLGANMQSSTTTTRRRNNNNNNNNNRTGTTRRTGNTNNSSSSSTTSSSTASTNDTTIPSTDLNQDNNDDNTNPQSSSTTASRRSTTSSTTSTSRSNRRNNRTNNSNNGLGGLMSMMGPMISRLSQQINLDDDNDDDNTTNNNNNNGGLPPNLNNIFSQIDFGSILSGLGLPSDSIQGLEGIFGGNNNNNTTTSTTTTTTNNQDYDIYTTEDELPTLLTNTAHTFTEHIGQFIPTLMSLIGLGGNNNNNNDINFNPNQFDILRQPLRIQLERDIRSIRRFYRHHPNSQLLTSTTIYPIFENDLDYGIELSLYTDRTVTTLLPILINIDVLTRAQQQQSISSSTTASSTTTPMCQVTPEIVEMIHSLQLDDGKTNETGLISLQATSVPIDMYLIFALHNMFGPFLTELISYFIALIRYGPYLYDNNQDNIDGLTTLDEMIPPRRLLWTTNEIQTYENRINNEELGQLPYLSIILNDPPFMAQNQKHFGSQLILLFKFIIGLLHQVYSASFEFNNITTTTIDTTDTNNNTTTTTTTTEMSDSTSPTTSSNNEQNIIIRAILYSFISFIRQSINHIPNFAIFAPTLESVSNNITPSHPLYSLTLHTINTFEDLRSEQIATYNSLIDQRVGTTTTTTSTTIDNDTNTHNTLATVEYEHYMTQQNNWIRLYRDEEERIVNNQVNQDNSSSSSTTTTTTTTTTQPRRTTTTSSASSSSSSNTTNSSSNPIDSIDFNILDPNNTINDTTRTSFLESLQNDSLYLNGTVFKPPQQTSQVYNNLFGSK